MNNNGTAMMQAGGTQLERVTTGIEKLDLILEGGLIRGGVYIVQGPPGAGKTILANQIAFSVAACGQTVAYLTLMSESHHRMFSHLGALAFFDPSLMPERLSYMSGLDELESSGADGLTKLIRHEIGTRQASLLVLDGLFIIEETVQSNKAFRKFVHDLQGMAHLLNCTMLRLTNSDRSPGSPEYTMVDGWIELGDTPVGSRIVREMQVHKFRGSRVVRGRHRYRITDSGIEVFPRIESIFGSHRAVAPWSGKLLTTGVSGLDRMLHGGLVQGSTSLLVGPSGTGKTIASLQFAARGTPAEPAVFWGFFEGPPQLGRKAAGIGIDLETLQATGSLCLHWLSPTEILVDQVADGLLRAVRRTGARRLVVDGLAAFEQNLVYSDRMAMFFTALGNELRGLGVTTLYTAVAPDHQGFAPQILRFPDYSPIVDNLFVMRVLERNEALHNVLTILKVPDRDYDARVTPYTITASGIMLAG